MTAPSLRRAATMTVTAEEWDATAGYRRNRLTVAYSGNALYTSQSNWSNVRVVRKSLALPTQSRISLLIDCAKESARRSPSECHGIALPCTAGHLLGLEVPEPTEEIEVTIKGRAERTPVVRPELVDTLRGTAFGQKKDPLLDTDRIERIRSFHSEQRTRRRRGRRPAERHPRAATRCRCRVPDDGYVIADELDSAYHPDVVSDRFERLVASAGLRRIRLHDCRHTAASLMLASGVPVKVVSELLGHSSPTITLSIYAHTLPGMAHEAGAALSASLLG